MLRRLRITISAILFVFITFFFLDFAKILPNSFHRLAHLQLVPAILSVSIGILVFLMVLTLLFGRIYCSSICPMGIFQDIVNRISRPFKTKKQRRFSYSRPKTILRWSIVALCILTFAFGLSFILGSLDPYSAYGRMIVNIFKPVYMAGNNLLANIFTNFNNYTFYKVDIYIQDLFSFCIGVVTFLLIGFFAWKYGRTWCNTMCPAGTILGFLSQYSFFKVRIDSEKCNGCGLCVTKCKASCINNTEHKVDNSRCVDCYNCLSSCKQGALSYSGFKKAASVQPVTDTSKRRFLTAGITTAAIAPKAVKAQVESIVGVQGYKTEHPIIPPGAISQKHFLSHCTSCHLCVSKCPSNVLKPAFMEYGIGGIMQPTVYFEKGFCNYDCTVCGEVCPNGAIKPLTTEEKHHTQMGYVVFIEEYCIVRIDGTSCGACSEHCPTQAIAMVPYKEGGLTIPKVNTDICVGCGGCEYVCPARPRAVLIEGNPIQKEAKPFHDPEQKEVELDGFGF